MTAFQRWLPEQHSGKHQEQLPTSHSPCCQHLLESDSQNQSKRPLEDVWNRPHESKSRTIPTHSMMRSSSSVASTTSTSDTAVAAQPSAAKTKFGQTITNHHISIRGGPVRVGRGPGRGEEGPERGGPEGCGPQVALERWSENLRVFPLPPQFLPRGMNHKNLKPQPVKNPQNRELTPKPATKNTTRNLNPHFGFGPLCIQKKSQQSGKAKEEEKNTCQGVNYCSSSDVPCSDHTRTPRRNRSCDQLVRPS